MSQPATAQRVATSVPMGRMGMWWFLASEVVIFGGLIVAYVLCRFAHPEWGEYAGHTIATAGAVNTMVLLTSSLTVVLAHKAAHDGQHAKAAKLLMLTLVFGLMFLGIKSYEYTHEIAAGFTPVTNLFWSFYYIMTGLHGLHVVAGMVAIGIVAMGVKENPQRVEYAGMYWHLVDIVWIFLFPLLYLAS